MVLSATLMRTVEKALSLEEMGEGARAWWKRLTFCCLVVGMSAF